MNLKREWRSVSVGGAVVLVLVAVALLVQHLRHEWPFAVHPVSGSPPGVPRAELPLVGGSAHVAHPRVPVELDPLRLPAIGVRVERVKREAISRPLRTVATVVPDESRISHVHTRVSGWIEQLYVSTTGESVRAGQPLAGIFSQELLSSQNEYLVARSGAGASPPSVVLQSARSRLKVLGVTEAEIRAIETAGEARRLVTVSAPRGGVVVHRGISVGTAVDPSTELVTIADLSQVWVLAEVPEADIPFVLRDTPARLDFVASGRPPFEARVGFLYPTLTERTRTLRVRFVVENRDGALRPGLYGGASFQVRPHDALTVPRDAIVDIGDTQHVFVVEREGRFAPRSVKLGARLDDRVEVREGLSEGDSIVASGVFLIDSESRLRASGGGTGHVHGTPQDGKSAAPAPMTSAPVQDRLPSPTVTPPGRSAQPEPGSNPPPSSGHEGH